LINFNAMTRRKTEENYIRSLTKVSGGTSYAVTIPMEYIRKLKWRGKQKLEVKLFRDRIVIRDWKQ
jgi:antitoxin component of MazEF toxin-antitoxin module